MKKSITTLILLATLALNVFAQQEIPMFFDNELGLEDSGWFTRRVTYNQDGSRIAAIFKTGKIAIWDASNGREITRMAGHNEPVTGIVFSPNGRQLVSCAGRDSTIKIWDTTSGTLIRSISQAGVSAVSFSPDGSRIAGVGVGLGNDIKIRNAANGSEIRTLTGHTGRVQSVIYSRDGRQILTASDDGTIKIWDAGNGQTLRTINGEARIANAVYSPNERNIAIFVNDRGKNIRGIRIYNAENGQELRSIPVEMSRNPIYSPDGRQLLVNAWIDNGNTKIIKIFDPDTGRELRSFNCGDYAFAYSPDGRRILTDSETFELRIGDNTYGASYATLLDATTGRVTGTIGYGPLNVGARAYADLQIARFLNDTAAVNRHEAILQFITGRGNATRAEIEAFYRNNIRGLIEGVVDREFQGRTVPAGTITYVKNSLTNFYSTPNQTNFNVIKRIHDYISGNNLRDIIGVQEAYNNSIADAAGFERAGRTDLAESSRRTALTAQNALNTIRRQLNAPNDAPIDWGEFGYAYRSILNGLNTELVRRM